MALFSPWGNQQFFDDNGNPATGWKIYTYAAGSSTPLATYTTEAGTVAQSNPIILNSLGFVSNPIFLTAGLAYKLVLTNASDVVKGPPVDGITGVTGTASTSQWQASGLTPTYVSATSFTLAGDQTTNFHVKRRIQSTNTAGTITSTITATAYTTLTTVTVVNDSGALDSGLSAVNLGLLTANNPSVPTSYAKSGANSDITSLTGTITNDSAAAGKIGEYIESYVSSFSGTMTTSVVGNITSISLTAGDWDVSGVGHVAFTTSNTLSQLVVGFSTTSATLPGLGLISYLTGSFALGTSSLSSAPATARFSLAATTTIYLVARADFSAGTLQSAGRISARRVR